MNAICEYNLFTKVPHKGKPALSATQPPLSLRPKNLLNGINIRYQPGAHY